MLCKFQVLFFVVLASVVVSMDNAVALLVCMSLWHYRHWKTRNCRYFCADKNREGPQKHIYQLPHGPAKACIYSM